MKVEAKKVVTHREFHLGFIGETWNSGNSRVLYQLETNIEELTIDTANHFGFLSQAIRESGFEIVLSDGQNILFYEDIKAPVRNVRKLLRSRMKSISTRYEGLWDEYHYSDYDDMDWDEIEHDNWMAYRVGLL